MKIVLVFPTYSKDFRTPIEENSKPKHWAGFYKWILDILSLFFICVGGKLFAGTFPHLQMQIQMLDYSWQKTHMHLLIASCLSKFWIFSQQCWSMKCALFAASMGKTSSKLLTVRSPESNGDRCWQTHRIVRTFLTGDRRFSTCKFMHSLTMRARDSGQNEVQSCFWRAEGRRPGSDGG